MRYRSKQGLRPPALGFAVRTAIALTLGSSVGSGDSAHAATASGKMAAMQATRASPGVHQVSATSTGISAPINALYAALSGIEKQSGTSFAQRTAQLAPAIDAAFNIPTVLRSTVGLRFDSLPPDQKQKLSQVFRDFTVARYVSNFAPGSGDTFRVLPDVRPSPYGHDQIVQTELTSSSGTVIKIDYLMRQFPQGWQAVDVLLDGHISQAAVQRSDFGSNLQTGDANPLIESLQRKIQSFSST